MKQKWRIAGLLLVLAPPLCASTKVLVTVVEQKSGKPVSGASDRRSVVSFERHEKGLEPAAGSAHFRRDARLLHAHACREPLARRKVD
jgi:hypothetical protein